MVVCNNPNCGVLTNNPKYCSMRCAGIMNRVARDRKTNAPRRYCLDCGAELASRHKRCDTCRPIHQDRTLNYTLGQLRDYYKDKNLLALAAKIRGYGATIYARSDQPKCCAVCGYDKHYEVCHINPIKTFPDSATMQEIHALDNLIALCPNHHWEYDRGLLELGR